METPYVKEEMSDDEIYLGKLTIKEIKKILCKNQESAKTQNIIVDDSNISLRLIKTQSQPNLRSKTADNLVFSSNPGSPANDSFIHMENMVSKLCVSPRNSDNVELNNTLEVIDYVLNHGPNLNKLQDQEKKTDIKDESKPDPTDSLPIKISPKKEFTPVKDTLKITEKTELKGSPYYYTPCKSVTKKSFTGFVTPSSSSIQSKTPVFKTPANPSKVVKQLTPRNTPLRTNAYQHITSPIASYIKNCPQVPLVQDVHPKKPLPGGSSNPKFVRNPSSGKIQINKKNNENINLPSVAYKSAKKTKVIEVPDENKLPQSQWVKKITSFPRPTVMKHEKREMNPIKKRLLSNQEDSFNITCNQAEVSLCTQKSAFKSTNKQ